MDCVEGTTVIVVYDECGVTMDVQTYVRSFVRCIPFHAAIRLAPIRLTLRRRRGELNAIHTLKRYLPLARRPFVHSRVFVLTIRRRNLADILVTGVPMIDASRRGCAASSFSEFILQRVRAATNSGRKTAQCGTNTPAGLTREKEKEKKNLGPMPVPTDVD